MFIPMVSSVSMSSAITSKRIGFLMLVIIVLATPLSAKTLVRSTSQIEALSVQGIRLGMTAQDAFNTLIESGFKAGNLQSYLDWESDGIEFVRGQYASPEGYSSVVFTRRGERILTISETYNSPGKPIDAQSAIDAVRKQLNISEDSQKCKTTAHSGLCEISDSEEPDQVNTSYKLQILSTMRLITISRPKELIE